MKRKITSVAVVAAVVLVIWLCWPKKHEIVLTGIVTTDEIVVGSEIQGRVQRSLVREGDMVTNGQLLAVIQPQEWRAEMDFYSHSQEQSAAGVAQAEADLNFQRAQSTNQIQQAEASLSAASASVRQGEADLENDRLTFERAQELAKKGVNSTQEFDQARTAFDASRAKVEALKEQVSAAEAAVALAKSSAEQIASRQAALSANQHQLAAAKSQTEMAEVRLNYTELRAPTNAIVNVRAALAGEVVTPGQAVVTLIDQDNLWVRADVEETYVDSIRLGDHLKVRLPSGVERDGTVIYRGADAGYATQRDVNRSKRDIKTFEIRVRCDNVDRALAVGMTAYVVAPVGKR